MSRMLSTTQRYIICAIYQGSTLKSHRYLDGKKVYRLHPLDGPAKGVNRLSVQVLRLRGLIHSNQKFPAATYLLTEKGRRLAQEMTDVSTGSLTATNYSPQKDKGDRK